MSMMEWAILGESTFVGGLSNYLKTFQAKEFWASMGNTTIYSLLVTPPMIFFPAMLFAVLLSKPSRVSSLFRTLLFIPLCNIPGCIQLYLVVDTQRYLRDSQLPAEGIRHTQRRKELARLHMVCKALDQHLSCMENPWFLHGHPSCRTFLNFPPIHY